MMTTPPTSSTSTSTEASSSAKSSTSSVAAARLKHVWDRIVEKSKAANNANNNTIIDRKWPSYNDVFNDVRKSDYNEMLTCPLDLHTNRQRPKQICAQGAVCCAKMELFNVPTTTSTTTTEQQQGLRPYTGFLKPGTTAEHCILRFSSALQPMISNNSNNKNGGKSSDKKNKKNNNNNGNRRMARLMFGQKLTDAKLFPAVALKLFRNNHNHNHNNNNKTQEDDDEEEKSANVLFLGCKVGQPEDNFFAHCLCTQITSRMPVTLKPVLKLFQKYSDYPLALGLSNLCTSSSSSTTTSTMNTTCNDTAKENISCKDDDDLNFPFCLTLKPCYSNNKNNDGDGDGGGDFLDDLRKIPVGTVLYDIFASPTPLSVADSSKLQRIGRIVSTSEVKDSMPDDGLFFRHQKKDEDYQLRPDWKQDLSTPVILKDGTKGTAATLAGWELFEHQIQEGGYLDFETAA